ncbi:hypothetical protein H8N03_09265 [Ramlibacter sp. USB13]|uniref:Uncharacterized protein n=1 Tax=Ramlibacter cellulosilyticus TaxID=2764187 RepID=A0A923SAT9_9BURK|nr:hypothetical protein [Ramlibacter cellulosilyticus]MBC5783131.1 hypothetical protein [Ramlibacter cellulosilyticus]
MKNLLTPGSTLAVALLLGWAGAHGQMLGSPNADVLMGKPLDMSLPARFASPDAGDECVQADVFYGESRVNAGNVRATVTGPADQRRIRVESTAPIDEPVVTVSVRAGCRNTVTRNYTLLPEYPSETRLAALDARAALASAAAAVPLRMANGTAPNTSPRRPAAGPAIVARADAATQPAAVATRNAPPARALRKEARATGPRLRLEPVDLPERDAILRVSTTLAEPDGDASRRATAALLWQAINADPAEVLRTSLMIQKLEQELAQLRQSTSQTRAEMAALRQRLDQAQQPWYVSPLVVQLLALLVLAGAAAAGLFWYRTRDVKVLGEPWYVPGPAANEPEVASATADVVHEEPARVEPAVEAVPSQPVVAPVVAAPIVAAAAADDDDHSIDFELPGKPAVRSVPRGDGVMRVETLAATLEEADFLRSLGLRGDAMDILKAYLQDSTGPAPLAYLELMRLCEEAEDPAAVATVRRRYAQVFGVEAPRLAQITAEHGMDTMPDLSARITRSWSSGEALQVIEEALFVVPTPAAPLTLQAGRDLLGLYDLALVRAAEGGMPQPADAPLAPWAHAEDAQAAAQQMADADGGRHFALDVDLTAPAPLEDTTEFQLEPMLERVKESAREQAARDQAAREEAARKAREEEDAFSAAVASERAPVSRY